MRQPLWRFGEYLNPETLEKLKMAFQSIGQRLGFVSAGDERRAAVRAAREEVRKEERKKYEALYKTREAQFRSREAMFMTEKASFLEEIQRLKALLAQKG